MQAPWGWRAPDARPAAISDRRVGGRGNVANAMRAEAEAEAVEDE
jgi:hypothetical protein